MRRKTTALLGILFIALVESAPDMKGTSSLVVSSTEPPAPKEDQPTTEAAPTLPKIYDMRIDTNVSNRFAKTLVTSKVRNLAKSAQEATFSVVIPEQAYISGFTMEIDGNSYEAYVQEKEEAKNTYNAAVASGQSAAHVAVSARDSNRFTVSVNIEPQSKATFYLSYEELLPRQNGKYELVLNIHPGQPVKNLKVEVNIAESRPLKFVKTPSLRSGNEISKNDDKLDPLSDIKIINKTSAVVKFVPDIKRQKQLASSLGSKEENGLSGQFIVQYDVERDPQGGQVLVDGGYFVHFFAPTDLPALPKHAVFILDTSGSMQGVRISQLKEAMNSILSELNENDVFNIVEFGTIAKVWNVERVAVQYESSDESYYYFEEQDPEPVFQNRTKQPLPSASPVNKENIKKANEVVKKLNAFGGTDIQSALSVGLQLVENNLNSDKRRQPLIIFLTDGEATVGEVDNELIIKNVTKSNEYKTPIFSLSFGDGADRKFLEKISLKNLGFARHIYEGADAPLQLQEFYRQISSPLLSKVHFKYVSNVSETTRTEFPILFSGSEIVVSGQMDPGFIPPAVEAWSINGPVQLLPFVETSIGPLERLWAYLTLKQILEQRDAAENKTASTEAALKLALKYSFVSDVTSLVVVKPNQTDAVDTVDAASNNDRYPIIASGGLPLSLGPQQSLYAPSQYGGASVHQGVVPGYQYQAESLEEESAVYFTTPLVTPKVSTPTDSISPTPTKLNNTDSDNIKLRLPWLSSVLKEDGTLEIQSGTYMLGLNHTVTDHPECTNAPQNSTGLCRLLHDCPKVHPELIDEHIYAKYFCALNGYAGVCCPKEEIERN